ncbi:MAG: N-acetylmuramoyl-L-alanine amidase [Candidatus Hydrogenedentes bacterium]|nr:N-acetylmuramoyl-L-alanine amidase [Candidatus Hydrogenedentota bacterium]
MTQAAPHALAAASEGLAVPNPVEVTELGTAPANTDAPTTDPAAPSSPAERRSRWVVVLDAGHGGDDAGESGPAGTLEKNVTLSVAAKAVALLEGSCQVAMTRTEDKTLGAAARATAANNARGSVFVSIHLGASASPTANGIEVFVPSDTITAPSGRSVPAASAREGADASKGLARQLAKALVQSTSATSRGVHTVACRVFQGLNMPGVLVEVGFISNATEEALLADEAYQGKIATGIASGILAFLATGD